MRVATDNLRGDTRTISSLRPNIRPRSLRALVELTYPPVTFDHLVNEEMHFLHLDHLDVFECIPKTIAIDCIRNIVR